MNDSDTMRDDDAMRENAELYALGGLEPAEKALVEEKLRAQACRKTLAQGRLAAYAVAASAAEQPPASLRDRVLAVTRTLEPKVVPLRAPVWRRPGWLAAAAAAVVVIFAATWAIESNRAPHSWAATCTSQVAPCLVSGRVVALGSTGLRLEAHGLQPLPAGRVYQVWYIRAGAAPTPAPVFVPDAHGNASIIIPVGAEKGLTVALTIEPAGGSKAPTTKPFLVASIE